MLWLTAGLGLGFATAGCFALPADAVTFSCDLDSAPACPDGYSCEDDGCCHREGSDVEAHYGECRLGGGGTGTGTGGTDSGTGTGTGGTDSGTGTGG